MVIFGGATGDTGKYIITGDTYALDLISSKWSKLEGKWSKLGSQQKRSCYMHIKHKHTRSIDNALPWLQNLNEIIYGKDRPIVDNQSISSEEHLS